MLVLASAYTAFSQTRIFNYNEVSTRDGQSNWSPQKNTRLKTAFFSDDRIELSLDRKYDLNIVSTTHLPDKGVVYVCDDQQKSRVTVMLIGNAKMFVYDNRARNRVKLIPRKPAPARLARNSR